MSQAYTDETQKILNDFLQRLQRDETVQRDLVTQLKRLVAIGKLGQRSQVERLIAHLEAGADELQD